MEKIIDVIAVITVIICIIMTVHTPNGTMGWTIGFISGVLLMLLTE